MQVRPRRAELKDATSLPLPIGVFVGFEPVCACVFVPCDRDTVRYRRLHPVFGWDAI